MQIDEMAGATSGRQEKLAEQIALAIERDIIEFALPAGTNLGREGDLTARFGVSRSVFREAVRLVVDSGLASVRRGQQGGLIVKPVSEEQIAMGIRGYLDFLVRSPLELMPIRGVLEEAALLLGMARLDLHHERRLLGVIASRRTGSTPDQFFGAYFESLREVSASAKNPILSVLIITLSTLLVDRFAMSNSAGQLIEQFNERLLGARIKQAQAILGASPAMAIDSCRECLEEIQAVYALAFQNRGDLSDSSSSLPPTIQAFRLGHEQCSRADLLALEIKRRILNGELAEGDRLGSEQELVERFGVSRAVVREAGRILERLSIVETVLGKRGGMHVRKPDPESVLERTAVYFHALNVNISHVQEVALPLGLLAVEMAAREAPNLPQDQMKAELAKLVDIPSENWIATISRFSTIIANLAGSPPLAFLLNIVNGLLTFEEAIEPPSLELHHAYIGQATNLMAAIAAGDVALSRRYLLHIRAILAKLGPRLRGLDDVVAQTQFPRFTHLSTISARAK